MNYASTFRYRERGCNFNALIRTSYVSPQGGDLYFYNVYHSFSELLQSLYISNDHDLLYYKSVSFEMIFLS